MNSMLPLGKTKVTLAVLLLLSSGEAMASGDPSIIYWFLGAVITQLTGLVLLLLKPTKFKVVAILLYLAFVGLLWRWAWNESEMSNGAVGILLIALPLVFSSFWRIRSKVNKESE